MIGTPDTCTAGYIKDLCTVCKHLTKNKTKPLSLHPSSDFCVLFTAGTAKSSLVQLKNTASAPSTGISVLMLENLFQKGSGIECRITGLLNRREHLPPPIC